MTANPDRSASGSMANAMSADAPQPNVTIRTRPVSVALGIAAAVIVVLSIVATYLKQFPHAFTIHYPYQADLIDDFTRELDFHGVPNIATWYNMLLLDLSTAALFIIAHFKKAIKDPYKWNWTALAWIVFYVAIDRLAVLNARFLGISKIAVGGGALFESQWHFGGLVLIVLVALLFFQFWRQLEARVRSLFLAAGVLYFVAALINVLAIAFALAGVPYVVVTALEQALDYAAAIVLLSSLLQYLESFLSSFSLTTNL